VSTRADELEKRVEAGFARQKERAERPLGIEWGEEFAAKLAFLSDAARQFVTAALKTPFNELAVGAMMGVEGIKAVIRALPEHLRQCRDCAGWWPDDDIVGCHEVGGRIFDDVCPECVYRLAREYGEDN